MVAVDGSIVQCVGFEVLIAVTMKITKITIFWNVTPCNVVEAH
jgi:hypothetical protein